MGNSSSRDEACSNQLTVYDLELLKIYWDSAKNKGDLGENFKILILTKILYAYFF